MAPNSTTTVALSSTKHLPELAAFVAVVAAGSFTGAARSSGVDKTVLSRRVKRLEAALATQLLHRTTRAIAVTDAGRSLFEAVADPLGDVLTAMATATDHRAIGGTVRLASMSAFEGLLADVLVLLSRTHPDLHVIVTTEDDMRPLVDGGYDLAVRSGHLPDSTLIARRLSSWRYHPMASPRWVATHRPEEPEDLAPHWVLYGGLEDARRWRFRRGDEVRTVTMNPRYDVRDAFVIRALLLEGEGVSGLPRFLADAYVARGELVPVLPAWTLDHEIPVWAVLPHRTYVPPRVQAVVEAFQEVLGR